MPRLILATLLLAVALAATTGSASAQNFVECADFTPASVQQACDRAIPIECRGPDAPSEFDQCLRDNGTSPDAVRTALEAAQRAAGIPIGGVDTGMGGLARDGGDGGGLLWLGGAALLLLAALVVVRARRA